MLMAYSPAGIRSIYAALVLYIVLFFIQTMDNTVLKQSMQTVIRKTDKYHRPDKSEKITHTRRPFLR